MQSNQIKHSVQPVFDENFHTCDGNVIGSKRARRPTGTVRLLFGAQSFENDTSFGVAEDDPFLGLCFNLGNDINITLLGEKLFLETFQKNHYNFISLPRLHGEFDLRKGRSSILTIQFTPGYFQILADIYPFLKGFLRKSRRRIPCAINKQPVKATTEVLIAIYDMLNNPFIGKVRDIYMNSRILEIVLLCLRQIAELNGYAVKPTFVTARRPSRASAGKSTPRLDVKAIQKVQSYLSEHLNRRFSLSLLAYKVGIPEHKIQRLFKKELGKSLTDYLFDERMKRALLLLRDTSLSMKEIAVAIGYKDLSSFSFAFKRKYGTPPTRLKARSKRKDGT